jgi:PEP-CTERM motif-containing protein
MAQPSDFNASVRESYPEVWKAFAALSERCHQSGPRPSTVLQVSDTKLSTVFSFARTASVSTGPAASYTATSSNLNATFGSGGAVLVTSAFCGGVCLTGTLNGNGTYTAMIHQTGSFQGLFQVTFVSPVITGLFGDVNVWLPGGPDSLTTRSNTFTAGGTTATADMLGGLIGFQTPVPEPGTLALLGSGILGLAGVLRREINP